MGRVAIIDDVEDTLDLLKLILADGHEVLTYSSGESFLKQFRLGNFDLVLLDLAMPGMDGFEVFRQVRRIDEDVPVAVITAMAFSAEREKVLRAGFCDYFVKPILEIESFRQAVYSHVGKCANPPYSARASLRS